MTTIDPAKMAQYRETARRRQAEREQALLERRQQALALAHEAARLLRQRFGAERVILFGSLARDTAVHAHTDVDLAVWGLPEKEYLRAVSSLLDLGNDISIDLVRLEEASLRLRQLVETEGVPI
jgi:uncharacterized protein